MMEVPPPAGGHRTKGLKTMTAEECRDEYGEAHDAHIEVNGECPWCGGTE